MKPIPGWMITRKRCGGIVLNVVGNPLIYLDYDQGKKVLDNGETLEAIEIRERPKLMKAPRRKSGKPNPNCLNCHGTGRPFIKSESDAPSIYDYRHTCLCCECPKPRRAPKTSEWPAQPSALLHVRRETEALGMRSKPRRAAGKGRK